MNGLELELCRANKYHNPVTDLPEDVDAVHLLRDGVARVLREVSGAVTVTAVSFLSSVVDVKADLLSIGRQIVGEERWARVGVLMNWGVLERHRRFLRLQDYLRHGRFAGAGGAGGAGSAVEQVELKKSKLLSRSFFVVDPLTLVIPLLIDMARKAVDWDEEFALRLRIVQEDERRLGRYFNKVVTRFPGCELLLFEETGVEGESCDGYLAGYLKTVDEVKAAHGKCPWLSLYKKVMFWLNETLRHDTCALGYTKCLPATRSMPDAAWDLSALGVVATKK